MNDHVVKSTNILLDIVCLASYRQGHRIRHQRAVASYGNSLAASLCRLGPHIDAYGNSQRRIGRRLAAAVS